MSEYEIFKDRLKAGAESVKERGRFPFIINSVKNYARIEWAAERHDLNLQLGATGPALVLGSGPSLSCALPHLKELRAKMEAPIFCTPSQMWMLFYKWQIVPNYVVVHDPWPNTAAYLSKDIPAAAGVSMANATFLMHPGCTSPVFDFPGFPDETKVYLLMEDPFNPESGGGPLQQLQMYAFGENNSYMKHPLIHAVAICPGTTLQAAILATYMGYSPIYFIGYDLCYWKHKPRTPSLFPDGTTNKIAANLADGSPPRDNDHIGMSECGFEALTAMIYEKITVLRYQLEFGGLRMIEVVAEDTPGNLQCLPRVSLDSLLGGKMPGIDNLQTQTEIHAYFQAQNMKFSTNFQEKAKTL